MSTKEQDQDYTGFVAQLAPKWRVIRCRDGIQWILQRSHARGEDGEVYWEGRSYCRSRDGLIDVIGRLKAITPDPEAMRIIRALPAWIEQP